MRAQGPHSLSGPRVTQAGPAAWAEWGSIINPQLTSPAPQWEWRKQLRDLLACGPAGLRPATAILQVPEGYNYRAEVTKLIPQLQVLDEVPATHTGLPTSRKLDQDWLMVKQAIKKGSVLDSPLPGLGMRPATTAQPGLPTQPGDLTCQAPAPTHRPLREERGILGPQPAHLPSGQQPPYKQHLGGTGGRVNPPHGPGPLAHRCWGGVPSSVHRVQVGVSWAGWLAWALVTSNFDPWAGRPHGPPTWRLGPKLSPPEIQPWVPRPWPLSLLVPGGPLPEDLLPKGLAPEDDASNLTHGK